MIFKIMNDVGKSYFIGTEDNKDIISIFDLFYPHKFNISIKTYFDICKKHNGFKGYKGKYYFSKLDDVQNVIKELESYAIMEKLTK